MKPQEDGLSPENPPKVEDESQRATLAMSSRPKLESQPLVPYLQVLTGVLAGQVYALGQGETVLGREDSCQIALTDPGISRQHAKLASSAFGRVRLSDLGSTNGTFLGDDPIDEPTLLVEGDLIGIGSVILKFGYQEPSVVELASRLFVGATRDRLTGTLNRGHLMECFEQQLSLCRRHQFALSLIMLDVDHFKQINDTYGHPAGDAVLRGLASRVRASLRLEDVLGRYGGEEFAILLPHIDREGALVVAERLRSEVECAPFEVPGQAEPLKVTISVGVATNTVAADCEALVASADAALYLAKRSGRNRVVQAE